jgi:hypothetical protein
MYTDYTLKSSTEATMNAALIAAGLAQSVTVDGSIIMLPLGNVAIDRIGAIPGTTGYHANVRVADDVDYDPKDLPTVTVLTPYRVWA